jgi:diguanylate cyclase (GGDEF)-like protein
MVTVISRFRVRNGLEEEVRRAFRNRPRRVEKTSGFCGFNVLTDASDPAVFLLLTRWIDAESFRAWHSSEEHHRSHGMMPRGLKLDATFTSITVGNHFEDPNGIEHFTDAFEGRATALAQWLTHSTSMFAFLLASDGTIRARNHGSDLLLANDPATQQASTIWDYLQDSNAQTLREWLLDTEGEQEGSLRLNVADAHQNRTSLDVTLVRCGATTLLIGTHERTYDSSFQAETARLTSDLSLMMRDSAQQNRMLKEANETIARLARTDALTGLANRRTLDEALQKEIARAERENQTLSVIMTDLDHFKSINDNYGHLAGDQVLASAASLLENHSRPYDLAARYGGEEFVLLLPLTSTDEAIEIAERIRIEVAKIAVPGCPRQITASFGVASWMPGETPDQFVTRADSALYRAKGSGRNRVEDASAVPA